MFSSFAGTAYAFSSCKVSSVNYVTITIFQFLSKWMGFVGSSGWDFVRPTIDSYFFLFSRLKWRSVCSLSQWSVPFHWPAVRLRTHQLFHHQAFAPRMISIEFKLAAVKSLDSASVVYHAMPIVMITHCRPFAGEKTHPKSKSCVKRKRAIGVNWQSKKRKYFTVHLSAKPMPNSTHPLANGNWLLPEVLSLSH